MQHNKAPTHPFHRDDGRTVDLEAVHYGELLHEVATTRDRESCRGTTEDAHHSPYASEDIVRRDPSEQMQGLVGHHHEGAWVDVVQAARDGAARHC